MYVLLLAYDSVCAFVCVRERERERRESERASERAGGLGDMRENNNSISFMYIILLTLLTAVVRCIRFLRPLFRCHII